MAVDGVTPETGMSAAKPNRRTKMVGQKAGMGSNSAPPARIPGTESAGQRRSATKRVLVVVGDALIVVAIAPLLLWIALFLACTDRRSVLVREDRLGSDGVSSERLTFRTRTPGCDRRTGSRALLHRTRLDELPFYVDRLLRRIGLAGWSAGLLGPARRHGGIRRSASR